MKKANRKKKEKVNRIDKLQGEQVTTKRSKFKIIFISMIIIILVLAIRFALVIFKWQSYVRDMVKNEPSKVYDTGDNLIATLGDTRITKNVSANELPQDIKDAYVSIEDQRFYKHHGVDMPRTAAAIFSYLKNMGSSSFGGSSITQQLVKNLTGENSSKVSRKVKEWFRAYAVEGILSKDEILNSYLNIIYVGPNIYGVGAGSQYYFSKDINKLSLAECAFLAGINNSPNSYNPFSDDTETKNKNLEKIKVRTTAVINKMSELGYITEEEKNSAIAEINAGLKFKKGNIEKQKSDGVYSYHTDSMIPEVIEDIAKKKNISESFAENYLYMAGLKIYSAQDPKVQETIETELSQKKYILNSKKIAGTTSQSAMVIIENGTGKVVGLVGGSGTKKDVRGFNRATQATRQTGSAGKPVAVLVPAIDLGLVTPITKIVDEETTFDDGSEEGYKPKDYNKYRGEITVRQAVESSQNIPFVKMMEMITPKVSIKYMKKMGITTLTKVDENINLALGGLDKGIRPYQLAVAYTTIANDGMYIEPTFYIKVENANGKTVVKPTQKKKRIYSKDVAYVVKSLLEEPVNGQLGTARYCKINGMDVAAKTGTTNDEYDRWLCGFTPYYTATTWFGFDMNETINYNGKNPSGQIWANVMKQIHKGKDKSNFEIPGDVEIVKICSVSHLPANSGCKSTYDEYFAKGTCPSVDCDKHKGSSERTNTNSTNATNTTKSDTIEQPKTNTKVDDNSITSQVENTINSINNIQNNTITEIKETITNIEIPNDTVNESVDETTSDNSSETTNVESSESTESQVSDDTSNASDTDDTFEQ